MKLNFSHSKVSEDTFIQTGESLHPYIDILQQVVDGHEYEVYESSILMPGDNDLYEKSRSLANNFDLSKIKYIIDIGIGGSNLGTKAIYDAFYGFFDMIEPHRYPKMLFLDTVNNEQMKRTCSSLQSQGITPEEVLIVLISKSGGTTETVANFELLHTYASQIFAQELRNVIAITDEDSHLWNKAHEMGIACLPIPKPVGGRFSVFSPVGIFPLEAAGINTKEILQGALDMRNTCLSHNILQNPAAISAIAQFNQLKQGKTIHDTFIFQSNFESIGKWYRQLMGESIGKEQDLDGNIVNTGITPNLSIGSTDLHSVGQLYLGGPKDKMTEFVFAFNSDESLSLPQEITMEGLVDNIASKSTSDILHAILEGVMVTYEHKNLPFISVDLESLSLFSIGQFMQFKMIEMMYLGKLLHVNTFDQPNVESYKVETKRILSSNS